MLGILRRRGGKLAHFDACLTPLGIRRTDDPVRGDIALVDTPQQGAIGGIVLGVTVAMLKGPGIIIRQRALAPMLAAWSLTEEG